MALAGVTACKQQRDVYCVALRLARADAGVEGLGSPFDPLPPGAELDYVDVLNTPHLLITEKGRTTLSHLEHPPYDESLRELREGDVVYFLGDEDEKHPVIRQRVGEEERIRYGFKGTRCLEWNPPKGCEVERQEYMLVDMRCGPSREWLRTQPQWPTRPTSRPKR